MCYVNTALADHIQVVSIVILIYTIDWYAFQSRLVLCKVIPLPFGASDWVSARCKRAITLNLRTVNLAWAPHAFRPHYVSLEGPCSLPSVGRVTPFKSAGKEAPNCRSGCIRLRRAVRICESRDVCGDGLPQDLIRGIAIPMILEAFGSKRPRSWNRIFCGGIRLETSPAPR